MGNHGAAVALLYGSGNGHGARSATDAAPLVFAVGKRYIDILAVVCGDVDIERIKLHELVEGSEQCGSAVSFQWRQHLE